MAKKQVSPAAHIRASALAIALSGAPLLIATFPLASLTSTALGSAPFVLQLLSVGALLTANADADSLAYEACSLFDATQGLSNGVGASALLNPGADIDLTTTTDFEDLAAPVADIMEFADQDRALLVDSVSAAAFFTATAGAGLGLSLAYVLSCDVWRGVF